MSNDQANPIYWFNRDDPEMQQAFRRAGSTFRFLWRELSWEYRRIIPALQLAAAKTAFADRPLAECSSDDHVEHMWLGEIIFDGRAVTGKLLNKPNQLKSVKSGDVCSFPVEQLTDWMYASSGRVYGAFTVNLLRLRMNPAERQKHDAAWGLDFGDPGKILLADSGQTDESDETEHPMSINMRPKLIEHLQSNPEIVNQADERGWTFLHRESLAGNAMAVEVLLQHGADRNLQTNDGDVAIDLAKLMRWQKIIALLSP
ncbi:MAG: DUF2314 domain-containing protein [Verrucomicrobiae bacterium]|nr:DUF2314 domain-containing protein [Verrucomicrobiae bacterium]